MVSPFRSVIYSCCLTTLCHHRDELRRPPSLFTLRTSTARVRSATEFLLPSFLHDSFFPLSAPNLKVSIPSGVLMCSLLYNRSAMSSSASKGRYINVGLISLRVLYDEVRK